MCNVFSGVGFKVELMGLFTKKTKDESIEVKKNWYADRYQTVVVQRNFLALVTVASLAGIIFSVLSVVQITSSKSIEPFVIQIEDKTGITNVVRPIQVEKYSKDETLNRYFLTKYITKREGYNYGSFQYDYFTVVRLLSNGSVYNGFKNQVAVSNANSPVRLGSAKQRLIKITSIIFLQPVRGQVGVTAQVRFRADDTDPGGNVRKSSNKLATVNFLYMDLVLTSEERAINPLNFQVIGYKVDDEVQ